MERAPRKTFAHRLFARGQLGRERPGYLQLNFRPWEDSPMGSRFDGTREALDYFDSVDRPALDAMQKDRSPNDLSAFVEARRIAADRVRAAFSRDMRDVETPENIELMSVESIRRLACHTLVGRMLSWLP
jgi:hypothetical protein